MSNTNENIIKGIYKMLELIDEGKLIASCINNTFAILFFLDN